jgi:hypothetical protein
MVLYDDAIQNVIKFSNEVYVVSMIERKIGREERKERTYAKLMHMRQCLGNLSKLQTIMKGRK